MTSTTWRLRWTRLRVGRRPTFRTLRPQFSTRFRDQCVRFSGRFRGYRENLPTVADMQEQQLMTLTEMCELLGITESTAYYWRQIGKGPKGARIGKNLRYRRSDVMRWVD